ncbi:AsmA family protein [Azospirillum sp. TSO35-2]|uniref:AsmA family protein n=1 Tax=Azospirillum sp. TSO35-2 TaxID=716796 RepID=UPI000D60B481|nr:AsmA family protein [Azospirillum sp. TSO35-2]PWC39709.1 hypothetical protein TSO352_06260 [Azospirillum sp. TSO35-2]
MKKILIAALAGLVVLAGLLLAAPSLIDWNAYKGAIAERVSAATGRTVELRGNVGFTLLPSPALTVRDARLANASGAAEADMVRLKKLDARVALGPLLGGRIQVESIALVEPTFVVEVLKDGRINWDLATGAAQGKDGLAAAEGLVSAVSFDQVLIDQGTVIYRDDRNGRVETVEGLTARIAAGSLTGPFQFQGDFSLRGLPLHGEATAGRFTEGAAVPVRATLSMQHTDATLRFAGILTGGAALKAQGDLRAEGSDFAKLLDSGMPAALAQPYNLRATVEAGTSLATFSSLEAQLGDTRATGSATFRSGDPAKREAPRTDLTLAINRLDLDSWLSRGASPAGSGRGAAVAPAAPAAGTGSALRSAVLALPAGMEAKLDVAVDGLTYNGGVVRQGRIEASLSAGRLNIDRVSALLPGGSDIVAAGEVTTPGGQPTLDLRMEANADNLRALLDWAKLDIRGVPADRLRRASLSARLQGHADRFEMSGLDFRVDSSRLTGAVAYVDRGRPAFGARLELDRLNLDGYLPVAGPAEQPSSPSASTARPATAQPAAADLLPQRLLGLADANLDLRVGQLTVGGLPIQGLRLDATVAGGALTVREAKVEDLVGLSARIDGQIASLSPLRGVNLALTADAESLGGLPRAVSWPPGLPAPERLGAVTAKARLAGDGERMAVEASAGLLGGTLDAGGAILGLDRNPTADLKLRATQPELGRIAALFTDRGLARALGPLDLYGELGGSVMAPTLGNIQGLVAGVPVRGKLVLDRKPARPAFQADLQTGDLDLDRLRSAPLVGDGAGRNAASGGVASAADPAEDVLGDLGWLRGADGRLALTSTSLTLGGQRIVQPALRATLADGIATLEQLDGEWQGGQIGLSGRLATAPGQAPKLDADITVIKAALGPALSGATGLGLSGGTVDIDAALSASGRGEALLRSLSGRGRAVADGGVLRGVDLTALRNRMAGVERTQDVLGAVAGALQGGETKLERLDARFTIERGVIRTDDARLTTGPADGTLSGTVSLPDERVDLGLVLRVKADNDLPPLTLRIAGPWATPNQTLDLQALKERFGSGSSPGAANPAPAKP